MAQDPSDRRPGLRAEQRVVADSRILQGAMAVFAEKGLEGTVDDVAEASGVSRRTVFRHFDSHSELFAAALERIFALYTERLPGPPGAGEAWDPWLERVCLTLHELHRDLFGRGFWYLHTDWPGAGPEVRSVLASRAEQGQRTASRLAGLAWSARGCAGAPPGWVVEAFGLVLSGFGWAAMAGLGTEDAAACSARILAAAVAAAAGE